MRFAAIAVLLLASPAFGHHPAERLDEVMEEKEPAFEMTDVRRLPKLDLVDAAGQEVRLENLSDRIVVLSFAPEACGAPCEAQLALLERVREAVNITPMKDMVSFVRVVEPLATDLSDSNAIEASPAAGATVADMAGDFAELSSQGGAEPLAHVIDRRSRHSGLFRGDVFGRMNMVLYINGLTNARPPKPGLIEKLGAFF